jgi:hypothetical protein
MGGGGAGVRRVLKSAENKAGGKAIGVGTIIKFLAGTEMAGGGEKKRKSREKEVFSYQVFSQRRYGKEMKKYKENELNDKNKIKK